MNYSRVVPIFSVCGKRRIRSDLLVEDNEYRSDTDVWPHQRSGASKGRAKFDYRFISIGYINILMVSSQVPNDARPTATVLGRCRHEDSALRTPFRPRISRPKPSANLVKPETAERTGEYSLLNSSGTVLGRKTIGLERILSPRGLRCTFSAGARANPPVRASPLIKLHFAFQTDYEL